MAENIIKHIDLHLFEGDGGAGAAPAAAGDGGESAVTPGVLEDGTRVDNRLAERMEQQARKRRERGEAPIKPAMRAAAPQAEPTGKQAEEQPAQEAQEMSLDDQWKEAKKRFRDQYGRDVQAAIQDRFKNQADANETLEKLQPALKALARQRGIDENDLDGLANNILEDDSLYEEEAEKAGMTVEGYRTFQAMQAENERIKAREQEELETMRFRQHFASLVQQGEEMKKTFPDFDLKKELENETFRRMTAPNSGLSVRAAYYAVHHAELEPQAMAYGIQKAQTQMAQTLQANRQRPMEGAMQRGQPADVSIDPRSMTREQRQNYIERARRGEKIVF